MADDENKYDIITRQGVDWERYLKPKNDDGTYMDMSGYTYILFVRKLNGTVIIRRELPIVTYDGGQAIHFKLSHEDTRSQLPVGAILKYEIEERIGDAQPNLMYGTIKNIKGSNDDS